MTKSQIPPTQQLWINLRPKSGFRQVKPGQIIFFSLGLQDLSGGFNLTNDTPEYFQMGAQI